MEIHINLIALGAGTVLVLVGILLQRFLGRKQHAALATPATGAMRISFDESADAPSGTTAPTPRLEREPVLAQSPDGDDPKPHQGRRPSFLARFATNRPRLATPETEPTSDPNDEPMQLPEPQLVSPVATMEIKPAPVSEIGRKRGPLHLPTLPPSSSGEDEITSIRPVTTAVSTISLRTGEEDDEARIPASDTAAIAVGITEDDDDVPVDFSGLGVISPTERERLLREMEQDLAQPPDAAEDEMVPLDETPAAEVTPAPTPPPPPVSSPAMMVETFRWTTFMGADAQSLGASERSNLIRLLRDMHDIGKCLPILIDAFDEERPEDLRPLVLEAIIHSYNGENLRGVYEYCAENGSEAEQSLARAAILTLS
jgi:hypothetical protein